MNFKKPLALVSAALMLTFCGTTAFAHHGYGHHGYGRYAYKAPAPQYQTCNYEDCQITENHTHDGCYYYGHYEGDGHEHCFDTTSTTYPSGCANHCHNY